MSVAEAETTVSLARLVADAGLGGADDVAINALALDSRGVSPGAAFVALAGHTGHGIDHLDDALARGAAAVLYDAGDTRWSEAARQQCRRAGALAVALPRLAVNIGPLAAAFYGHPDRRFHQIVAVTGTNGKTSVTHFLAHMLDEADAGAAVVGTLGNGRPGATTPAALTTPDAVQFQATLAELADTGARRLAVEASSHGLAQFRLDGTRIDAAVLTHIGRDHLDYHGSHAAYVAAKQRLFGWPGLAAAALNADQRDGARWAEALARGVRAVTYGRGAGRLRLQHVRPHPRGLALTLAFGDDVATVDVPLMGPFNADNAAAAVAALVGLDYDFAEACERLQRVRPVAGRMELFRGHDSAGVVVDYAHNAEALAAALDGLRAHTEGRVWCIFGAGGDRDRGKRAAMGAAAARGADRVIVTDDNPRSEDPAAIVDDILVGMPDGSSAHVEHDRGRALAEALRAAGPRDLILLAGKGHESRQIRAGTELAWSDRDAAHRALATGGPR